MIVSFGSERLASLLNSRDALTRRCGRQVAATIGCRLYDLCAATVDTVGHIPNTTITTESTGEVMMTITCAGYVVIRGLLERAPIADRKAASDRDRIVITALEMDESDRR